jgi:hypothetical protein
MMDLVIPMGNFSVNQMKEIFNFGEAAASASAAGEELARRAWERVTADGAGMPMDPDTVEPDT